MRFDCTKCYDLPVRRICTQGTLNKYGHTVLKESVTVFFTFDSAPYSALGSVRKEAQLPLHFFPQGRRLFEVHPPPKLE